SAISFYLTTTPTSQLYTLSLHDALPISHEQPGDDDRRPVRRDAMLLDKLHHDDVRPRLAGLGVAGPLAAHRHRLLVRGDLDLERSEEHTSELQSRGHLVCRLLLEKKKTQ